MKNKLKVSTLSIICVLCATGLSGAYGASSVRTLGGAGTYTSAASASQSGGGSTGVARAGSVRISPTTAGKATTATTSNSATTTAGRTASTSRLSLGKYLGGGTAISGGSSTRPGNGAGTSEPGFTHSGIDSLNKAVADLKGDVIDLQGDVTDLQGDVTDLQANKQDTLRDGEYIEIDKDNSLWLNVDKLKTNLGYDVDFRFDEATSTVEWKQGADGDWTEMFTVGDMLGSYATVAQMEADIKTAVNSVLDSVYDKDAADAKFATKDELEKVVSGAEGAEVKSNKIKDAIDFERASTDLYPSEKVVVDALATKADKSDFETRMEALKSEVTTNMDEVKTELAQVNEEVTNVNNTVNTTVNNAIKELSFTKVEDGEVVLDPESVSNIFSFTSNVVNKEGKIELADGVVTETKLNKSVADQLVGTPNAEDVENTDGMYVMLVDARGNHYWVDLATEADATGATTDGGGDN